MLSCTIVRELLVDPSQHPRGAAHLSAASSLVRLHDHFYVVADDELQLGVFAATNRINLPLDLLPVFAGAMPHNNAARKLAKPDLEALAVLPGAPNWPAGALLALGSGSRATRERGALITVGADGRSTGAVEGIDLSALYLPLHARFADLNIEGAFVACGKLHLLHRGNSGDARNACVCFSWDHTAAWLAGTQVSPPAVLSVQCILLGMVGGVPLGLTDAAALPGGAWVFCAVAEDTASSYHDGSCNGSVVGVVAPDGTVRTLQQLQGAPKVEGIAVQCDAASLLLSMVTDADDPAIASQLLQVRWQHAI